MVKVSTGDVNRRQTYKKYWRLLYESQGGLCFYCGEAGYMIDHIIPVSYGGTNTVDNLVISCSVCNLMASDKVFEDVYQKRQFIRGKRKRRGGYTRCVCSDCLLPFQYRIHSPALFLCAECYDLENKTSYRKHPVWHDWLVLLEEAEIPYHAHRDLRAKVRWESGQGGHMSKAQKTELLTDLIAEYYAA